MSPTYMNVCSDFSRRIPHGHRGENPGRTTEARVCVQGRDRGAFSCSMEHGILREYRKVVKRARYGIAR